MTSLAASRALSSVREWARRVSAAALLASGAASCQVVAGDFSIGPAPAPIAELGLACAPNSHVCEGAVLKRCADDRSGYVEVETCSSPDACDPASQRCRACTVGDHACNGAVRQECTANQTWYAHQTCASPELCVLAGDRRGSTCEPARCTPGSHRCDNGRLERCAADGTSFRLLETCPSPEACDFAFADASVASGKKAHCVVPACPSGNCGAACSPGTVRCSRELPTLERCSSEGRWITQEVCFTHELCSVTGERCLPPACGAGERRCDGSSLQVCSADLTRYEELERCDEGELCDPDAGCVAIACVENAYRCNGNAIERCTFGSWEPTNHCATAALCNRDAGRCDDPICGGILGDYQCMGLILNRCSAGRDEWNEFNTCDPGKMCTENPDLNSDDVGCD